MTLHVVCTGGSDQTKLTLGLMHEIKEPAAHCAAGSASLVTEWLERNEAVKIDMLATEAGTKTSDSAITVQGLVAAATRYSVILFTSARSPIGDPLVFDVLMAAAKANVAIRTTALAMTEEGMPFTRFETLVDLMRRLRDPETGCPWDREQNFETLKKYVIEEAYEVVEAIDSGLPSKISEELGDLLLQVVFQSEIARQSEQFEIGDVINKIVSKLVRRHPHVFGTVVADSSDQVLVNWEQIKRTEAGYEDRVSILDGIPTGLPALMRAQEVSKRVVKVGFEWPTIDEVLDKVEEEIRELRDEIASGQVSRAAEELGDLLFTIVNVGRQLGIDAEESLRQMTFRFAHRFRSIEDHAELLGISVKDMTLAEMEAVWQAAKAAV